MFLQLNDITLWAQTCNLTAPTKPRVLTVDNFLRW
jgi:hypothetical protein